MTDCPFCNVVSRDKVYADSKCYILLDRMPLTRGHLLIIPNAHHETMSSVPVDTARHIGGLMPTVLRALKAVIGVEESNVVQNNGERASQTIPHVHFHIIPRPGNGDWNMFGKGRRGHGRSDLDDEEAETLKQDLRTALNDEQSGLWNRTRMIREKEVQGLVHVRGPNARL